MNPRLCIYGLLFTQIAVSCGGGDDGNRHGKKTTLRQDAQVMANWDGQTDWPESAFGFSEIARSATPAVD